MFTRRNWLLRCSILINIVVILYLCSHVMIGRDRYFTGPGFFIPAEEVTKTRQMASFVPKEKSMEVKFKEQPADAIISAKKLDTNDLQQPDYDLNPLNNNNNNNDDDSINNINKNRNNPEDANAQNFPAQQQSIQDQQYPEMKDNAVENVADEKRYDTPGSGANDEQQAAGSAGTDDNKISNQAATGPVVAVAAPAAAAMPDSENPINNVSTETYSGDERDLNNRIKSILKCHDREYKPEIMQRGDFWVLKNYVRADHGELKCHETITYTTHSDYTFLDNIIPLIERWNAPISMAIHAPGTDFPPTVNAIKYLRDCIPESHLIRYFVTFHIYFSTKHIPKNVPTYDKVLETPFNCSLPATYSNVSTNSMYKTQKKLLYPVNVGRNIARDAALTNFVLASDVELYPNPGLVRKFLEMIARNDSNYQRKNPKVWPLPIFEVDHSSPVPKDKTELQELLRSGKAIPFHKRVCSSCHGVPKSQEWMAANETEELSVFHIGKRTGYFIHWEPIYIGTHSEPHYDERLSWEGKSDKMTQGYALCALDYEFHILDNGFLVHKPGIKVLKKDTRRAMLAAKTNQLIKKIIYPELRIIYGVRKGCAV